MARSTYIYVVLRYDSSGRITGIAGTFTVKHELLGWLRKQPFPELLRAFRCRDYWDTDDSATEMNLEEY